MEDVKTQELAGLVIKELGGVSKVAQLCNIAPSSVCLWKRNGIPAERENYLRTTYPDLTAWTWELADLKRAKKAYEQSKAIYERIAAVYEQKLGTQEA